MLFLIILQNYVFGIVRKQQVEKCNTKRGIYIHMQLVAPFRKLPRSCCECVTFDRRKFFLIYECFDQTWMGLVEVCVKSLVPRESHQNLVIIKPSATWQFFLIDAGSLLEVFAFLCGSYDSIIPRQRFSGKNQIE